MPNKILIFKAQDLQMFTAANTAQHLGLNWELSGYIDYLFQRDSYLKITSWTLSLLYQAIVY